MTDYHFVEGGPNYGLFVDLDRFRFDDRVRSGREQLRFNEPNSCIGWNVPADDPDAVEILWQDLGRP